MAYQEDYLSHHGILGQKWGVRRYQNPDGSLTEAGKKRYVSDVVKQTSNKKAVLSEFERRKAYKTEKRISEGINRAQKAKELKSISDEARKLQKEYDAAYSEWIKTNKKHAAYSDESYARFNKENPKISKKQDQIFDLAKKYKTESKKYFDNLLGEYGKNKLVDTYAVKYDVSEYLADRSADYFFDLVWTD